MISSEHDPYSSTDTERLIEERPKREGRSPFARDRARVLHTAGLRRLAAKTQVMVAGESDFPRTRLTHTLEVAQIAREIGDALGCDPDLADLAGLTHDLGHPPFGHNGEDALNEVAGDIGGFEGNAQSFRVLTRLEPKVFSDDGRSVGLNLTRASLDSSIKYPWLRRNGERKFNAYADDAAIFDWVREGAPAQQQCFESQIMDWSDDVAYSVHDIEDGLYGGYLDITAIDSSVALNEIFDLARNRYAANATHDDLAGALDRLRELSWWPHSFDRSHRAQAGLKNLTSQLVGRFVVSTLDATRQEYGDAPLIRYQANLVVPDEQRHEVAVLKAIAHVFVFDRSAAEDELARQRAVVASVTQYLHKRAPDVLNPIYAQMWHEAPNSDLRMRAVIDQVASLTDQSIARVYSELVT